MKSISPWVMLGNAPMGLLGSTSPKDVVQIQADWSCSGSHRTGVRMWHRWWILAPDLAWSAGSPTTHFPHILESGHLCQSPETSACPRASLPPQTEELLWHLLASIWNLHWPIWEFGLHSEFITQKDSTIIHTTKKDWSFLALLDFFPSRFNLLIQFLTQNFANQPAQIFSAQIFPAIQPA